MSKEAAPASPAIPESVPEEAVDSLYGLPLEEFTKARNELAAELRSRGEREAAKWVAGLTKPSAAAWAVNQVMRTQRKDARELLAAGERLREAHEGVAAGAAGAQDLRAATEDERAVVGRLSQAARGLKNKSGRDLSENVLERVEQTLHAIAADSETRSLASVGRLTKESQATGTSAFAAAPGTGSRGASRARRPSEAQVRKARERLERAQREVRDLRAARTRAARATSNAERNLARARDDMRAADQRVAKKESEIEELRRELEQLK